MSGSRTKRTKDLVDSGGGSTIQIDVLTHDSDSDLPAPPLSGNPPTNISLSKDNSNNLNISGDHSNPLKEKHIVTVAVSPLTHRRPSLPNSPSGLSIESKNPTSDNPSNIEIRVGVSAVQGRRKTMEDAHIYVHHQDNEDKNKDKPKAKNVDTESTSDSTDSPLDEELVNSFKKSINEDEFHSHEDYAFFGVFDGHGGKIASDYAAKHLHSNVVQSKHFKTNVVDAIKEGFKITEDNFLKIAEKDCLADGTTALVAFLIKNILYVGSVGDSEGVLCRSGKAIPLNAPHNPAKNEAETNRVIAAGGRVVSNRVAHPALNPSFFSIAVSRAIGDLMFKSPVYTSGKPSGLIADADVTDFELNPRCQFIILACDGLWDVMKHQEAVDLVVGYLKNEDDPQLASKLLVERAFEQGSMDNITAMVVAFQKIKQQAD